MMQEELPPLESLSDPNLLPLLEISYRTTHELFLKAKLLSHPSLLEYFFVNAIVMVKHIIIRIIFNSIMGSPVGQSSQSL